jgi:hypothetical protein
MTSRADPWDAHRFLKRVGIVSLPFPLLISALELFGWLDMHSQGIRLLVLGWIFLVLVTVIVAYQVRCPHCGQRFYGTEATFWPMAIFCLQCGQERYAPVRLPPQSGSDGHAGDGIVRPDTTAVEPRDTNHKAKQALGWREIADELSKTKNSLKICELAAELVRAIDREKGALPK